jgi:hypothetical protein
MADVYDADVLDSVVEQVGSAFAANSNSGPSR